MVFPYFLANFGTHFAASGSQKFHAMAIKEELRLGQVVRFGKEMKKAVIDGLTRTFAGLVPEDGGYVTVSYEDIYVQGR